MEYPKPHIKYRVDISLHGLKYPIFITDCHQIELEAFFHRYPSVCVITNQTLYDHFYDELYSRLETSCSSISRIVIRDGERFKTLDTLNAIYGELISNNLGRDGLIVAFGGGVVGDIAGFAAATFMRGIDYIQIPTTLLAMVDSSIGGKTGVNFGHAKNLIGAFHQPEAVFCDITFLDRLPLRQFVSGLMEVIKCGLVLDKQLYEYIIERRGEIRDRDRDAIAYLIYRACQLKGKVVGEDEREEGLRQILNFGHTIGHAIESSTGYDTYLHGEAVALGSLVVIGHLMDKGVLSAGFRKEFIEMLDFFSLPTSVANDFPVSGVLSHIIYDKKRRDGEERWVTLKAPGIAQWGQSIRIADIRKNLIAIQENE